MERKTAVILRFCSVMLLIVHLISLSIQVSANTGNTTLTTQVPTHCKLQIEITGQGIVTVNERKITESQVVVIQRHNQIEIQFQSGIGYQLAMVSLNGTDITEQIHSHKLLLDDVSSDSVLAVEFSKKAIVDSEAPPSTGDNLPIYLVCNFVSLVMLLFLLSGRRKQ